MIRAAFAALLALSAPVFAEDTLIGRSVTFNVLAYDDPKRPLFRGRGRTMTVSEAAVEFGIGPEGVQNGLDVVPVAVNIGERRIEVDFWPSGEGQAAIAKFNGYVLDFSTNCALFINAALDEDFTTLPLKPDAVTFDRGVLYINVSGLFFSSESRLAVDFELGDCPIS
jgi:hypothetical protein